MSQITRCPSCATLFKVVPDQLRISDGWVRCGHCQEVFDATLSLQQTSDPVLLLHSNEADPTSAASVVAAGLSGDAAQSGYSTDEVAAPATEALSKNTKPFLQAAEMPADGAAPDADAIAVDDGPAENAAPAELPAAMPEPDAVVEQAQASLQAPQLAGYELPAALLTDSDGEEDWAAEETSDEFPLQQPSPAGPQMGSAAPAAALWQPPFTPEFKAASLPQDEKDADGDAGSFASSATVKAEKTDVNHTAHQGSAGTSNASNLGQTTRSERNNEFASKTQALAEAPEKGPLPILSDVQQEPSFVRSARRNAVWHRSGVRWVLAAVALLLTAALLLQVAVQQRHYLASAYPKWRSALEALCVPLQCNVQPYQHIASVVVDGSAFNKLRGNTYRFALGLKNQSAAPVALPAVELTLTDTGDQPVLRRVLTPLELGAPAALLAGGEWSGSLEMDVALGGDMPARIAGYRVLAFYP